MQHPVAVIAALTILTLLSGLSGVVALRRPVRWRDLGVAVAGAGAVLLWAQEDHYAEGAILLVLSKGHGITLADLAAVPQIVLSTLLAARALKTWWRPWLSQRRAGTG